MPLNCKPSVSHTIIRDYNGQRVVVVRYSTDMKTVSLMPGGPQSVYERPVKEVLKHYSYPR